MVVETARDASLSNGYSYDFYTRSLAGTDAVTEVARHAEWLGVDAARTVCVYSIPGAGDLAGVWVSPLQ